MPAISLPQQLDLSLTPLQLTPGTYSELVHDTLGDEDWATGPSLAPIDQASGLVDGMGDDPIGGVDLVAGLGTLGGSIPAQGASTFAADMAAAQAAQDVKTAAVGDAIQSIPPVLELPLNPAGLQSPIAPPTQITTPLGNVSISNPPALILLGNGRMGFNGIPGGLQNVYVVDANGVNAFVETDERDDSEGDAFYTYYLKIIPQVLGGASLQVNYNTGPDTNLTIITYTMTVVP